MAESKRLRVSKACDSCRRKKVKCDAVHPLCTNCQTFQYECTYNDPTKKRGPPKGYIEAIEARLHRMEGLLGGLVQNNDPRAEIVRAELEAMAREAEMTGLKLRRSKAFEQLDPTTATHAALDAHSQDSGPSSSSSSSSSSSTPALSSLALAASTSASASTDPSSRPVVQPRHIQPLLRQRDVQHHRKAAQHSSPTSPPVASSAALQQTHAFANAPSPPSSSSSSYQGESSWDFKAGSVRQPQHASPGPFRHSSQKTYSYPSDHILNTHDRQRQLYPKDHHAKHGQPQQRLEPMSDRPTAPRPYTTGSNADEQRQWKYASLPPKQEDVWNEQPLSASTDAHSFVSPLTGFMALPQERVRQDPYLHFPSTPVMEHLLDVHFQFVHPVLPMLHSRTLRDQILRREYPPSHLFFAILGLASRFSSNPVFREPQPGAERPPCCVFYDRAKQLIKDEYDDSQLATVQALLLMAIQQMGFCESQRAWLCVGMAIRMAQDLGLNKEPTTQEQPKDHLQSELRKRTWWSCYVVERLVCGGLGRPLTITQLECETGLPQYIDGDAEMGQDSTSLEQPNLASNFVHLISLSRIQGNILQFIKARAFRCDDALESYTPDSNKSDGDFVNRIDTSQAAFSALDRSLTEWRQGLPPTLQGTTAGTPHFGLFLHMTYNALIILLHRPEFASSATSASLCTQAAATITDITETLVQAKALTSMFISCIYAIFSAGVIHFLNIPSVKRENGSPNSSSPTSAHPTTAKVNMKHCIDALKDLSSHWVSAARRAKILEDLLDLKHVSLKDVEEDSFKTTPLLPSWAVDGKTYSRSFAGPRDGHDQLRQKCRSKVMAIQSLLANDDEFQRMQSRRGLSMETTPEVQNGYADDEEMGSPADMQQDSAMDDLTTLEPRDPTRVPSTSRANPVNAGAFTPEQRVEPPSMHSQSLFDSDPMMLIATATLGSGTEPLSSFGSPMRSLGSEPVLTPTTLTTLGLNSSAMRSRGSGSGAEQLRAHTEMLDPFSVPSSITFPSSNHGRQTSCSRGISGGVLSNTVWSTDAQTHRTVARVESPSPMSRTCVGKGRACEKERKDRLCSLQQLSLTDSASDVERDACMDEQEHEDQDLAWNDMPPTLGLDEWMAYIGALMMRWLASGESSPRSPRLH
ncbi:hypothetical protein BGZ75_009325 [Mortierella antarctica]|nr:hypothetical protein BGZ75_009325 [Mortierella antarctica]